MKAQPTSRGNRSTAKATGTTSPDSRERKGESTARKKILLVDDHPMMRIGVTTLINGEPDLTVCCQASDAEEALSEIPK